MKVLRGSEESHVSDVTAAVADVEPSAVTTLAQGAAEKFVQAMSDSIRDYLVNDALPNLERIAIDEFNVINNATEEQSSSDIIDYEVLQIRFNRCTTDYKNVQQQKRDLNIKPDSRMKWSEEDTLSLFAFVQTLIDNKNYHLNNSFSTWENYYQGKRDISWRAAKRQFDRLLNL